MLIQKTVVFLLEDLSVSTALLIRTTVTLFGVLSCIDSLFYSTVCLLTVEVPIVTNINFLPLLLLLPLVTLCYPFLRLVNLVTPCYPCYPLLPYVTFSYPLLPPFTSCYPCYPLLPLLPFVSPCCPCYPCYAVTTYVPCCNLDPSMSALKMCIFSNIVMK